MLGFVNAIPKIFRDFLRRHRPNASETQHEGSHEELFPSLHASRKVTIDQSGIENTAMVIRNLTLRDLIRFATEVSAGMEFLSNKKARFFGYFKLLQNIMEFVVHLLKLRSKIFYSLLFVQSRFEKSFDAKIGHICLQTTIRVKNSLIGSAAYRHIISDHSSRPCRSKYFGRS